MIAFFLIVHFSSIMTGLISSLKHDITLFESHKNVLSAVGNKSKKYYPISGRNTEDPIEYQLYIKGVTDFSKLHELYFNPYNDEFQKTVIAIRMQELFDFKEAIIGSKVVDIFNILSQNRVYINDILTEKLQNLVKETLGNK